MKNIIIIIIVLFLIPFYSKAQEDAVKRKVDSLSQESRIKADLVLNHFDTSEMKKILYSISDEHYYVILKNGCCFKEYYIHVDGVGKINENRILKTSKRNRKLLEKAFDLKGYHVDFITKVSNPSLVQGNPSYFVIKDIDGKRYGEYWLSVITVPVPIDKQLYNYLFTKLLKESTR